MRIDPNSGAQQPSESGRSNAQNTGATGTHNSSGSDWLGQDQAELSGAHAQVQALAAQAAQLPEVREERVISLRQAIQSGGYRLNPEKVAHALFGHMVLKSA